MENLVNYAVAYAKAGLSVLPMDGKTPIIKFADRPPLTEEEIRELWKKYPTANIALKTNKFFVVDVDRHEGGEDGFKSLNEIIDMLPETLAQKTAGGGMQMFFLKRSENEVRQNIGFMPGIDVKAHNNNYVVVAPSSINGRKYEWLNKEDIKPAPKELIKKINHREKTKSNINYAEFDGVRNKTTVLFETLANGLGDSGERNNKLTSFIGGLLIRSVDPETAYKLAVLANDSTNDPLPMRELDRTFQSVHAKEYRRRKEAIN